MKLKDIAEIAGVSVSTVSRVLNDPYSTAASPTKQAEIWKIARDGGYVPNEQARKLKKGEGSEEIRGTMYCLLATDSEEYRDDPFYTTLISAIRTEALKRNYVVEYSFSEQEREMPIKGDKAEGLIIIGRFSPDILPKLNKKYNKNIVYIGLNSIKAKCDKVFCSGYQGMRDVVKELCLCGHRNVGYIGVRNDSRLEGFSDEIKDAGINGCAENVFTKGNALTSELGYSQMKELLKKGNITAVVCANDITAIGALKACSEQEIKVPEEMCIIGMDDIEMTRYVSPALSTVHVPLDEMASMAVKLLADRIEGGHHNCVEIGFPHWIVKRGSGPKKEKT